MLHNNNGVRRKLLSIFASATAFAAFIPAANAQEPVIQPSVGTLGIGLSGFYKLNESFGFSGTVSGFSYAPSGTYEGADYDGTFKALTVGATLDYYVNQSDFRISVGARYTDDNAKGTFSMYNPYLDVVETAQVKVTPEYDFQPYFGIGYDADLNERISFDFSLGAYYMGTPNVQESWSGSVYQPLQDSIDDFRNAAKDYKFYPVAQIGLRYRF
ncbi:hypothetical protein [Martelella radicis]|uniref:Outer membrane protein beta-barrel domain-containing protein n=1 Tax=Martelella radicis TaxID=1397476 RepID=A0A7W6KM75_9HYPH|nr:hypothetical protein [Martelella radicis]MBB4122390.1 hypothetical protein [Martelella radicis]